MKLISKCAFVLGIAAALSAAPAYAGPGSDEYVVRTKTPSHRPTARVAHNPKALHSNLERAAAAVRPYGPVGLTIYARDNTEKVKAILGWAEQQGITASVVETARVPSGRIDVAVYPNAEHHDYPEGYDWVVYEHNENDPDPEFGAYNQNALRAMLANRRDLVRGRGTNLSDGERAAQVVSQYRDYKSAPGQSSEQPAATTPTPTVTTKAQ